ncbi:MAG: hypothetical protein QHJ34_03975 [bacterium]|jgi:hypothetical protein|nr:hypothetical protein [candidate division KSB1 bacterium]MDH7559374.1 hypothetical protein [bacterium]
MATRPWLSVLRWVLAVLITLPFLAFQRRTGPTYPVRGKVELAGSVIPFRLPRSATVGSDAPIRIAAADARVTGTLAYRRYRSHDDWTEVPMRREQGELRAELPEQPPAGKVMYVVRLARNGQETALTKQPLVLRFKGHVPMGVLLPHIVLITLAMFFSNRAALEAMGRGGRPRPFILLTIALFLAGGFVLGPIVQKLAFGAFWTGFPFGHDLTDNKTLVAMLGWLVAWSVTGGGRRRRGWVVAAAVLMMAVYLIPHSLLGSELDYTAMAGAGSR